MFGLQHVFRGGRPTRLGPTTYRPDPHRLGAWPDEMGIVPPYTRDWGNYQTFWNGNQYPGFRMNQEQYHYPFAAIRHDVPGTASVNQLRGGAVAPQIGAVSLSRLIAKMQAAWASVQS